MTTPSRTNDPHDVVRGAVARVEHELTVADCSPSLRDAWTKLVGALALEPAPELRDCPTCGNVGMRAATRCGYCWASLPPIAKTPA